MDIDFFAMVEQRFDRQETRIKALEEALVQLSGVDYQPDPSRLPGVIVAPAPIPTMLAPEVDPNG
jgi:hypothetical protein